jgi:glycosyltransferase involved in cell wall biosynthesis
MSDELSGVIHHGPVPAASRKLRIAMVTSLADRCGIADYTRYLVDALQPHVEVAWLTDPEGFAPVMNEADVVHVQHQYFLFGGVAPWKSTFGRFLKKVSAPLVMTIHEFVAPEGSPARRLALAASNRLNFQRPSIRAFIVHTHQDHEHLCQIGVPSQRIHVIRHGVPAPPPMPSRAQARASLHLGNEFVITIFGFLSRRKGHMLALDALSRLPDTVRLILAGGRHPDDRTSYVTELEARVKDASLAGRAMITGYLEPDQAAAVMAATDLVLAPFTDGSGSGSLAFAFSCGKPILASAIAPHVEINRDEPGSLALFPPGDAEALAEAVSGLMRNARALTRMTEGSRRYASASSYAMVADATVAVYHQAIRETLPCG